ncbi:MAG: hypothetical protein Q8Q35_04030 [Nanoarchaeota archaeon]|nr:hypothetical protein [Nanoarchaeota archaeon]
MAIIVLLKLLIFVLNPQWLDNLAKWMLNKFHVFQWIYFALTIVLGYYILQHLAIIQVTAGVFLGAMLVGIFLLGYPKDMEKFYKTMLKQGLKSALPSVILWLVFAGLVLYSLF